LSVVPPHDLEAEEAVLGTVLMADACIAWLATDEGLRPEHFYREKHRLVYEAALALYRQNERVDVLTCWAELERRGAEGVTKADVHYLAGVAGAFGMERPYARRIVELAEFRRKLHVAYAIEAGVEARDAEAIAKAEASLVEGDVRAVKTLTPDQLADDVWAYVTGEVPADDGWPFPWRRITDNTAGGMRRGEVTLLGGWSSHGKSAALDQILAHVAKRGVKTHLYINEMTPRQRTLRFIARLSGIPFKRLRQGQLHGDEEQRLFVKAVNDFRNLGIGLTDITDWSAEDIALDIKRRGWDLAGVDILHLIDHEEERDLGRISRAFNRVSKAADCHLVVTVHFNERRVQSAKRPAPTLGDIRGSGMLKNDADNVLFVHREQSEDGTEVLNDGRIYLAKVRNGELGGIDVHFRGDRMRFDPTDGSNDTPRGLYE
jgi:replicative DNA helicase